MRNRRFLGLDLAWSDRNPSGVCALDERGRVVDLRADLRSDEEILAWIRGVDAPLGAIAIDMPTIVPNESGMRPCERELQGIFGRHHAGPYPANRGRFPDGGRARTIIDALAPLGVRETFDVPPQSVNPIAFETFPHAALVRLFTLPTIFRYKKKARPWPEVHDEWRRYRGALETLRTAHPPLDLATAGLPNDPPVRGYKRWDDALDAITCAYIALFVWTYGMQGPEVRVYGDPITGAIVLPDIAARVTPLPEES